MFRLYLYSPSREKIQMTIRLIVVASTILHMRRKSAIVKCQSHIVAGTHCARESASSRPLDDVRAADRGAACRDAQACGASRRAMRSFADRYLAKQEVPREGYLLRKNVERGVTRARSDPPRDYRRYHPIEITEHDARYVNTSRCASRRVPSRTVGSRRRRERERRTAKITIMNDNGNPSDRLDRIRQGYATRLGLSHVERHITSFSEHSVMSRVTTLIAK